MFIRLYKRLSTTKEIKKKLRMSLIGHIFMFVRFLEGFLYEAKQGKWNYLMS